MVEWGSDFQSQIVRSVVSKIGRCAIDDEDDLQ